MRCAVCPGFPIEQSPKYAPGTPADKGDDDGIDSDDYGGDNDNDDEDEDDNYCDGDVVVMISCPTLQPAPPAPCPAPRLLCILLPNTFATWRRLCIG